MKYVRVMDGTKSNAGGFEYKIDEVKASFEKDPETSKEAQEYCE